MLVRKCMQVIGFLFLISELGIAHASDVSDLFYGRKEIKTDTKKLIPFPTKAEFLAATESGQIPEHYFFSRQANNEDISETVVAVLKNDYNIQLRNAEDSPNGCLSGVRFAVPRLMEAVTFSAANRAGVSERAQAVQALVRRVNKNRSPRAVAQPDGGRPWRVDSAENIQSFHLALSVNCDRPFVKAFDTLMEEYAKSVDHYLPKKLKLLDEQMVAIELEEKNTIAEMKSVKDKQEADRLERLAQARATWEEKRDEEKARSRELFECMNSRARKIWIAASKIDDGEEMIKRGQELLAHDDLVAKESGTTNLALRNKAGELIVAGKKMVNESFDLYIQLGGTGDSPKNVHLGQDPCR